MRGDIALIGVGVCWATTPLWVCLASWDPFGTIMIRAAFTAIALFAQASRAKLKQSELRDCRRMAVLFTGAMSALSTSCFAVAFLLTDAGRVYVLYYTFPFMVLVSECYLGSRKPTGMELGILLLAFTGLLLVFGSDVSVAVVGLGDVVAFASALTWFLHILGARSLQSERLTLFGNGVGQLVVGFGALPLAFLYAARPDYTQLGWLIALGGFSALALILWSKGIQSVPGYRAGTITMVEAPGGVILISLLQARTPTTLTLVGGLMVLCAGAIAVSLKSE